MTAEIFTKWLQMQGLRVVHTASSFWYTQGLRVYQAFPYHHLIQPSQEEISSLFEKERALALRYSAPTDALYGCVSYHVVYDRPTYGFEDIGHRTRKNVRRGLRSCCVEPLPFDRLADQGWVLHLSTLSRQHRQLRQTHERWKAGLHAASTLPGFEAWGATVGGKLVAYIITFQMEDCCYILDQKSDSAFLELNVNNALTFTVTQASLARGNVRSILYAMHSLDAPESVAEFKYHMGYTQRPVRQCISFHPYASPFINSFTHFAIRSLARVVPENRYLSKAEGMMRIYLDQFKQRTELPT